MIHYTINITFTEVELFTIRYGINQAVEVQDTIHIIITDTIHSARRIFDFLSHSYQLQSLKILEFFFNKNSNNFINFWNCPSNVK